MGKQARQAKRALAKALTKITSQNEVYNLNGNNKLVSCWNHFDKTLKDGVIIDDAGITIRCPYCDGNNACIYEKCPSYSGLVEYLTAKDAFNAWAVAKKQNRVM